MLAIGAIAPLSSPLLPSLSNHLHLLFSSIVFSSHSKCTSTTHTKLPPISSPHLNSSYPPRLHHLHHSTPSFLHHCPPLSLPYSRHSSYIRAPNLRHSQGTHKHSKPCTSLHYHLQQAIVAPSLSPTPLKHISPPPSSSTSSYSSLNHHHHHWKASVEEDKKTKRITL